MLKHLLKDTVIYGSLRFFFLSVSVVVFPIYANILSVDDFGVMALVTTITALLAMLINFGINNSILRYFFDATFDADRKRKLLSTGFWTSLSLAIGITAMSLAVCYWLEDALLSRYSIRWSYIYLSFLSLIPVTVLGYMTDLCRLHFRPMDYAVVSFLNSLLGVVFGLLFIVVLKRGLNGVYEGGFIGAVLSIVFSIYYFKQYITAEFDIDLFKKIIVFGYPFILANISAWVFSSADRWMLASISGLQETGLYNVAFKFAGIISMVIAAFSMAWSPYAFKLYETDSDYRKKIVEYVEYLLVGLILIGASLSLLAKEILMLFVPAVYLGAGYSMILLIMGTVITGTFQGTYCQLTFEKRSGLISMGWVLTTVINIMANLALIPFLGNVGSALAIFAANLFLCIFNFYWAQKLHPLPYSSRKITVMSALTVGTVLFSCAVYSVSWSYPLLLGKLIAIILIIAACVRFRIIDLVRIRQLWKYSYAA